MRILSMLVAVVFGLTACGTPAEDFVEPGEGTPQASPTGAIELSQRCVNEELGFAISYPAGWQTNDGDVVSRCTVFHDESFALEEGTEIPFTMMVAIEHADVPFQEIVDPEQDRPAIEIDDHRETTVAGRDAVVISGEGTGAASLPNGMPVYRYAVDVQDGTFIAATYGVGNLDEFERKRTILDQMMASLEFTT